jgi:carbonic anhydrase
VAAARRDAHRAARLIERRPIEDLLENARRWEQEFSHGDLPLLPARRLAVLACMDARLPIFQVLGLQPGEAHVIRNAGGLATDDALRSLEVSRGIGTEDVLVVHHTDCGVCKMTDEQLRELGATRDVDENVRITLGRIRERLAPGALLGFVYEVETGRLRPVD